MLPLSALNHRVLNRKQVDTRVHTPALFLLLLCFAAVPHQAVLAQTSLILERPGRAIVLEPYAPNILRVTLSKTTAAASQPAGYGFIGKPSMAGWTGIRMPAEATLFARHA